MAVFAGDGLACWRGGGLVFSDLAFSVEAGGALVIVGPNGAGKSSLLRLMAGLAPPSEGTLRWDGADIGDDPDAHRLRLHFVGHQDALKPALTVAETLSFWAHFRGGRAGLAGRVARALFAFGLERLAELPVRHLSQGQRRRLALARLIASPAQLWLLDEPAAGLDRAAAALLAGAIAAHRGNGGIVALALHDEAHPPGARVLEIARDGRAAPPC
jgi:heme exporter protein A